MKKFYVKHSYPKAHNNHIIGIGHGVMNTPMPDMMEAQKYYNYHNEFSNRKYLGDVVSKIASYKPKNPVDFHSLGHKQTQSQMAGRDIDSASLGHRKFISADPLPKHNKEAVIHQSHKKIEKMREVKKVKAQHPEGHKAHPEKKSLKHEKLQKRKAARKAKRKIKRNL